MTDEARLGLARSRGAFLGAALGDALGKLVEFIDWDAIVHYYGPAGIQEPPADALYTDDTQLALAVARALVAAGESPLPDLVAATSGEFIAWLATQDSPIHRRGPGVVVMDAMGRLKRGASSAAAADGGANESVAVTRALPVALRYPGDPARTATVAAEVARITHSHPACVTGAATFALMLRLALAGEPPEEWARRGLLQAKRHVGESTRLVADALRAAQRSAEWPAEDAMEDLWRERPGIGGGWTADEVLGLGYWSVLANPNDYVGAVRTAANLPGNSDADSVAFVAGALAGAYLGDEAIPDDWRGRLEDAEEIAAVAEDLCRAGLTVGGQSRSLG